MGCPTAASAGMLSGRLLRLHQPNIHSRSLSPSRGCISRSAYMSFRHPCPRKHDRSCGDAYECCSRFLLAVRKVPRSQAPAACSRRASFAAGCSRGGSGSPPSAPSQAAAPAVARDPQHSAAGTQPVCQRRRRERRRRTLCGTDIEGGLLWRHFSNEEVWTASIGKKLCCKTSDRTLPAWKHNARLFCSGPFISRWLVQQWYHVTRAPWGNT